MNAPATPSRAVTVLVTRRVAPQGVAGFETAMAGMIEAATHFPGHLGGHLGGQLVRPGEAGGGDEPLLYHVVFAFDNEAHLAAWQREWGVTDPSQARGGITRAEPAPPARRITLLQRKTGKPGAGLGKTTGWIRRAALKMKSVEMLAGVNYEAITPEGLFISFGPDRKDGTLLEVDHIVLCAGQEPLRDLLEPLRAAGVATHLIGGADEASELDAKRAIDHGTRLAAAL